MFTGSNQLDNTYQNDIDDNKKVEEKSSICARIRARFGHIMCNRLIISLLIIISLFLLLTVNSILALLESDKTSSYFVLIISMTGLVWTIYLLTRATRNIVIPLRDLRDWTHRMRK